MSRFFDTIPFIDAQEKHRQHPDTFEILCEEELKRIKPGDGVKVCDGKERFWTVVKTSDPEGTRDITAQIDTILLRGQEYNFGDVVKFNLRHVYDAIIN